MSNELSEPEIIRHFLNGMREAENAARLIGHSRRSEQWIHIAHLIAEILHKSEKLLVKKSSLILS